jgi:hypothetical protein
MSDNIPPADRSIGARDKQAAGRHGDEHPESTA